MNVTTTLWELLIVEFPCGCRNLYRRKPTTHSFTYYDSHIGLGCRATNLCQYSPTVATAAVRAQEREHEQGAA